MQLFEGESEALPHELFGEEELNLGEFYTFKVEEADLATLPSPSQKSVALSPCLSPRFSPAAQPKRGRWSQFQNRMYFQFLYQHRAHFEMSQLRRIDKIFKVMSRAIGSRSAQQCRSHHQKMEKKYHRFEVILESLNLLYGSSEIFQ